MRLTKLKDFEGSLDTYPGGTDVTESPSIAFTTVREEIEAPGSIFMTRYHSELCKHTLCLTEVHVIDGSLMSVNAKYVLNTVLT